MSSAGTIVKRALNAIAAHSEINPADPELLSIGLAQLVALMEEHVADEILYGAKLTSLTSAALVATGTLALHGFVNARTALISGATEAGYNGRFALTGVAANTFTYALAAVASASPAVASDTDRGITALVFPEALAEPLNEQRGATAALQFILAVRMAPICRKEVSAVVAGAAASGYARLKRFYQVPTIPGIVPSRLLPRGQGSSRGPLAQAFFKGEELDADSST